MTSVALLCSEVRHAATNPETTSVEALTSLLGRYNSAVDEVNARFRRATIWLRSGLYSEAINYIELYPDALDSARELELGGTWDLWADAVVQADAGDANAIDRDLAAEINEAYRIHAKIEPVLNLYRRAALVSASQADQVSALRKLEELDPDNPVWPEQRRSIEAARQRVIQQEAKAALEAGDLETCELLLQELRTVPWLVSPSKRFVSKIADAVNGLRTAAANQEYADLADRLHDAMGAYDDRLIGELLGRWDAIATSHGDVPPVNLEEDITPIRNWHLKMAEEHASAEQLRDLEAEFEQLLDEHAAIEELERIHSMIARESEVPQPLERRYQLRVVDAAAVQRQRRRIVLAGSLIVITVLSTATVLYVRHSGRQRELASFRNQLTGHLNAEPAELVVAQRLVDQIGSGSSKWILGVGEIVALQSRLDQLVTQREAERASFVQVSERLKLLGFDDSMTWDLLTRAEELAQTLDDADRLALQTERDRLEVGLAQFIESVARDHVRIRNSLKSEAEEIRMAAAKTLDPNTMHQQLAEGLKKIEGQLVRLIAGGAASDFPSDYVRQGVTERLAELRVASEAALTQIRSEIAKSETALQRERERLRMLREIRLTHGKLDQLIPALTDYVDTYPEVGSGARRYATWFSDSMLNTQAWIAVEPWNKLSERLGTDPSVKDVDQAQRHREMVGDLVDALPVAGEYFAPYLEYLARAEENLSSASVYQEALQLLLDQLSTPPFTDMTCLEVPNSSGSVDRYYSYAPKGSLRAVANPQTRVFNLPKWIRTLEEMADASVTQSSFITLAENVDPQLVPAPHVVAAQRMREILDDDENRPAWDRLFITLSQLVLEAPMDDVLRVQLLAYLLEPQQDIGWIPLPGLDKFIEQADELLDVPWPSPNDSQATSGRSRAREIIQTAMPDLDGILRTMDEKMAPFTDMPTYEAVGLVWYDEVLDSRTVISALNRTPLVWLQVQNGGLYPTSLAVDEAGQIIGDEPPPGTPLFRVRTVY